MKSFWSLFALGAGTYIGYNIVTAALQKVTATMDSKA